MATLFLQPDPIAVWGLGVAVFGAIVGVVAAVAAIYAAKYAKAAPTKEDLKRVEEHAAATSEHLGMQRARAELQLQANRVSLSVHGKNEATQPLALHLAIKDPSVRVISIELRNEADSLFGSIPCECVSELEYTAPIVPEMTRRWFNAGTHVNSQASNHMQLQLHIFMEVDGIKVSRSMVVRLISSQVLDPSGVLQASWLIEGNV
jgi:hypothetical protein